jgi:hypothetical protein
VNAFLLDTAANDRYMPAIIGFPGFNRRGRPRLQAGA